MCHCGVHQFCFLKQNMTLLGYEYTTNNLKNDYKKQVSPTKN